MSEDNIPKPVDHDMVTEGVILPHDPEIVQTKTTDLVKVQKLFGIVSAIYNWQPTGLIIEITLPVENLYNSPMFCIRASPLSFSFHELRDIKGPVLYGWDRLRWVFQPVTQTSLKYDDDWEVADWLKVIEYDDVPDIAFLSRLYMWYSGGLKFSLRPITNMTTQGRVQVTRLNNVTRTRHMFQSTVKVPLNYQLNSQIQRATNGFDYINVAAQDDIEINMPYTSVFPHRNLAAQMNAAFDTPDPYSEKPEPKSSMIAIPDDYIMVDPVGLLDKSAGSGVMGFALWIKAADDFQLQGAQPMPNSYLLHSHADRIRVPYVFSSSKNSNLVVQDPSSWLDREDGLVKTTSFQRPR